MTRQSPPITKPIHKAIGIRKRYRVVSYPRRSDSAAIPHLQGPPLRNGVQLFIMNCEEYFNRKRTSQNVPEALVETLCRSLDSLNRLYTTEHFPQDLVPSRFVHYVSMMLASEDYPKLQIEALNCLADLVCVAGQAPAVADSPTPILLQHLITHDNDDIRCAVIRCVLVLAEADSRYARFLLELLPIVRGLAWNMANFVGIDSISERVCVTVAIFCNLYPEPSFEQVRLFLSPLVNVLEFYSRTFKYRILCHALQAFHNIVASNHGAAYQVVSPEKVIPYVMNVLDKGECINFSTTIEAVKCFSLLVCSDTVEKVLNSELRLILYKFLDMKIMYKIRIEVWRLVCVLVTYGRATAVDYILDESSPRNILQFLVRDCVKSHSFATTDATLALCCILRHGKSNVIERLANSGALTSLIKPFRSKDINLQVETMRTIEEVLDRADLVDLGICEFLVANDLPRTMTTLFIDTHHSGEIARMALHIADKLEENGENENWSPLVHSNFDPVMTNCNKRSP